MISMYSYTLDAVERMSQNQDVESLIEVLSSESELDVRVSAAEKLGKLGDERALVPLVAAVRDTYIPVHEAVVEAVAQFGEKAVTLLAASLFDEEMQQDYPYDSWKLIAALARIGGPQVADALISNIDSDSCYGLIHSVNALGTIGDPRAIPSLIDVLKIDNRDTRQAAATALGEINDIRAIEPLINAYHEGIPYTEDCIISAIEAISDNNKLDNELLDKVNLILKNWYDQRARLAELNRNRNPELDDW